MGYIEEQLVIGEKVTYRAHLHWKIFLLPAVLAALAVLAGLGILVFQRQPEGSQPIGAQTGGPSGAIWLVVAILGLMAAIAYTRAHILYTTSEFAVTNRRVIMKEGWVRRRTVETMLSKVEAIGVDQTVLGRIFGVGTLTITGTGGTKEAFARIANPLEFRKRVQGQVIAADEHVRSREPGASTVDSGTRDEIECPFCAELILSKAKVCKHCGRELRNAR
jgi:uncharacterized membrane protein YdbT with pleckstrin-like domain